MSCRLMRLKPSSRAFNPVASVSNLSEATSAQADALTHSCSPENDDPQMLTESQELEDVQADCAACDGQAATTQDIVRKIHSNSDLALHSSWIAKICTFYSLAHPSCQPPIESVFNSSLSYWTPQSRQPISFFLSVVKP